MERDWRNWTLLPCVPLQILRPSAARGGEDERSKGSIRLGDLSESDEESRCRYLALQTCWQTEGFLPILGDIVLEAVCVRLTNGSTDPGDAIEFASRRAHKLVGPLGLTCEVPIVLDTPELDALLRLTDGQMKDERSRPRDRR